MRPASKMDAPVVKHELDQVTTGPTIVHQYQPYPDIEDPQFQAKLLRKREMIELKIPDEEISFENACKFRHFDYRNYQIWAKRFLSNNTPYQSILLIHEVGTGKTCTSLLIAETLKPIHLLQGRKVMYFTKASLKDSVMNEIYNPLKSITRRKKSDVQQCLGESYGIGSEGRVKSMDEKRRMSRRKINKVYNILSYGEINSNLRSKLQRRRIAWSGRFDDISPDMIRAIQEEYSNRLYILDEVHTIKISGSSADKMIPPIFELIFRYANNIKIVMMSATPMYDTPRELIFYINLMRLAEKKRTYPESTFFDKEMNLRPTLMPQFLKFIQGRISFVRGRKPPTFPFATYNKESVILNMSTSITGQSITQAEQIKYTKIIPCPVSAYQYDCYQTILRRVMSSTTAGQRIDDVETQFLQLEDSTDDTDAVGGIGSLLQVSNCGVRSKSGRVLYGADGFMSDIDRNNGSALFYLYRLPGTKKLYLRIQDHMIENKGTRIESPFFDRMDMYSSKLYKLWENIKSSQGVVYVYTEYKYFGALMIAAFLEYMGFERYTTKGENSLLDYQKNGVGGGGKKPRVDYESCDPITNQREFREKHGRDPKFARYIILSGSVKHYDLIKMTGQKAAEIINSPDNLYGSNVRVIIGTRVSGEGLDLHRIRQIHIMEPWYNLSRLEQIEGRGVRQCSHKELPPEERNVEIFRYQAVPPTITRNTPEMIDYRIYRLAENKDVKIKTVEAILKKNAVDCYLWKNHNFLSDKYANKPYPQVLSSGDKRTFYLRDEPYSRTCAYSKQCMVQCSYEPKGDVASGDVSYNTMAKYDSSTYPEIERMEDIIKYLIEYLQLEYRFTAQMFYDYLVHRIGAVDKHHLLLALQLMIDTERPIYDMLDREGTLQKNNRYYYFLPKELGQYKGDIPDYYLTEPLPRKVRMISLSVITDRAISSMGTSIRRSDKRGIKFDTWLDFLNHCEEIRQQIEAYNRSLHMRLSPNDIDNIAFAWVLDRMISMEVMAVLTLWLKKHQFRELPSVLKRYFAEREHFYTVDHGRIWIHEKKHDIYQFAGKKGFVKISPELQTKMYHKYTKGSVKKRIGKDGLSGLHGYLSYMNGDMKLKLFTRAEDEIVRNINDHRMKRSELKGRVCDTFKTNEGILLLRQLVGGELPSDMSQSKSSICDMIEFVLRVYNDKRKNHVRWFYVDQQP